MNIRFVFTKEAIDALPLPDKGKRTTYHDHDDEGGKRAVNGLQLRVTSNGVKSFCVLKRVAGGAPERITLGKYPDLSIGEARKKALATLAQLAAGESVVAERQKAKAAKQADSLTLAKALEEYVAEKQRNDGKPLKERTRLEYLKLVKQGKVTRAGRKCLGGMLAPLADKPLHAITAGEIRDLHKSNLARSQRQAVYSMVVLRAVLNWHGIHPVGDPFSRDTHGRNRIVLPSTDAADEAPVTALLENLGPWWRTVAAHGGEHADYMRLLLLTGCRPSELLAVAVGDIKAGAVRLHDTKNRRDHTVYLSRQANAIVERHAEGKADGDKLFTFSPFTRYDAAHELAAITGLDVAPKNLRAAFASIAEDLVSAAVLRRMMNHFRKGSVTDAHYIKVINAKARDGWQKVADHIEALASDNVVPIKNVVKEN